MHDERHDRATRLEQGLLLAAVFSLPLQSVLAFSDDVASLTLTKAAGALLILFVATRRLLQRRPVFTPTGIDVALGLFGVACALSWLTSIDPDATQGALATLVTYALVLYAAATVSQDERTQRRAGAAYCVAATLSGAGAVAAWFGVLPATVDVVLQGSEARRVCFGMNDANEQAMMFLFALAWLLFSAPYGRGISERVLQGSSLVCVFAGLFLTMSRSGWLLAAGLIAARLLTARYRVRWTLGAGVTLAATALLALLVAPGAVRDAGNRLRQGIDAADPSLASRVFHYTAAVDAGIAGGLTGHGLATNHQVIRRYPTPLGDVIEPMVHNVPLILWLETGLLGIAAYLWLWSAVLARFSTARARAEAHARPETAARLRAYLAMAIVYGLVSLVMPFFYRSALPVLLGCGLGAATLAARGPAPEPQVRFGRMH